MRQRPLQTRLKTALRRLGRRDASKCSDNDCQSVMTADLCPARLALGDADEESKVWARQRYTTTTTICEESNQCASSLDFPFIPAHVGPKSLLGPARSCPFCSGDDGREMMAVRGQVYSTRQNPRDHGAPRHREACANQLLTFIKTSSV